MDSIVSDGLTVRVTLSAPLHLPFFDGIRDETLRIVATTQLDYRPTSQLRPRQVRHVGQRSGRPLP